MRTIDHIIIHCSATREDRSLAVEELETIHRRRGFEASVTTTISVVTGRW